MESLLTIALSKEVLCCVILNLHCDHVNGATWLGYQFALFITANGLSRHLCIQLRTS